MHFHIEIDVNGQPATFHFEPSTITDAEPGYRVSATREPDNFEFRMSKVEGEWHITQQPMPDWLQHCESQLAAAIRKREYPQDV